VIREETMPITPGERLDPVRVNVESLIQARWRGAGNVSADETPTVNARLFLRVYTRRRQAKH